MRNVVYVAPFPLETTMRFSSALGGLDDVRLLGVFQQASAGSGPYADAMPVANVFDVAEVVDAIRVLERRHGRVHRVLGILEDLQVQLAMVRAELGVPGLDVDTAVAFRDKAKMKDRLRAAGLPCARHKLVCEPADAWAFVDHVGFPIVLKPPAGAGCRATYRVENLEGLRDALAETRPGPGREVLAEEFLVGAEFSFETLTLRGEPRFHSISRYYPGPLEVMEKDWIQWAVVLPRDISGPEYDDARELGRATIEALGLDTAMTHMEWFRRSDGSLAIGEIAARPPGAQIVNLTGQAHDRDMYRAWARLVVDGVVETPIERKYSAGVAFLRGPGSGRVSAIDGLEAAQKRIGHLVVDRRLPQIGAPRASGYEGEGWAMLRDPDTDVVKQAIFDLITTVKVRYA